MIKTYQKGVAVQLSPHFSSLEFDCHCKRPDCDITYIDSDLVAYLERKREEIGGKSIRLNCGFRCSRHNKEVGGKPGSFHMNGKAADVVIPGLSVSEMTTLFKDADGLGIYQKSHFVHVDVRGYKSRWHD